MVKYFRITKRTDGEIYSTRLNDDRLSPTFYRQEQFWGIHEWVKEYEVDDQGNLRLIIEAKKESIKEISDKILAK